MDLKGLIRVRASYKSKLTQFKSYLEVVLSCESLSNLQLKEINIRLSKFEELYAYFDSTQSDIERLSEIPDDQFKERKEFEDQYYAAVAGAREVLDRHSGAAGGADSLQSAESGSRAVLTGGPSLKLPTIQLPSFSGRYQDWLEFHDTYASLIHSNNSIPTIHKFHYLRAALTDSAALIIRSLDFSADNYEVAWSLLCDRYNNNRLLINNHIQAIFNIEPVIKESARALRNIIDIVNKNLRALATLKLPTDHWDVLVIYMISNKLDPLTRREWEEHRNTIKDIPTLNEFQGFLKNRADLLETMAESQAQQRRRHSDVSHVRPKTFVANQLTPPSFSRSCALCNNKHAVYQCPIFKSLTVETRLQKANSLNLCLNCLRPRHPDKKCRLGPCLQCSKWHNSLLHTDDQSSHASADSSGAPGTSTVLTASAAERGEHTDDDQPNDNIALSSTTADHSSVLLSTALVDVADRDGNKITVRALLDNGSTCCLMTEKLYSKLNLPAYSTSTSVEGLNCQSSRITKRCDVAISSRHDKYVVDINCFIVPQITQLLPVRKVDCTSLNIPPNIFLADPTFHLPSEIDLLLGAEIFWSVLGTHRISLGKNKPSLNKSKFGYLVSGTVLSCKGNNNNTTVHCNFLQNTADNELQNQLNQFFELETVRAPDHNILSKDDNACERHFTLNTTRQSDGRFIVKMPLKESPGVLGDSYEQALSRFLCLERRFKRDPNFKNKYCDFISEYIKLGHMTENKHFNREETSYILPHHGVLREMSLTTKLRAVFDGSAVTTSGLSLNNIQHVGPTVQDDLISILIRFRQHRYVVSADIDKFYRQCLIHDSQRNLQQILWRFNPTEELKTYKLNTVTYGTASAPYLATRCLVQLGKECADSEVASAILHDFYIDDLISGHDSEDRLIQICNTLTNVLHSGQFHLRKWRSNNSYLLNQIQGQNSSDELLKINKNEYSKTLGLLWSSTEDNLTFSVDVNTFPNPISKRNILSTIAKIFDPLGLINPIVLQAKIILQRLWATKVSWDEPLSSEFQSDWANFVKHLHELNNIIIPRRVLCLSPIKIEIHAFSDASIQAYSACIYIRSISQNGEVSVHLIMAKSKVAPPKPTTIPRLELCGALLSARLVDKVKTALRLNIDSCYYWCDSTIVLGWINSPKLTLKSFVLNRINEITENTDPSSWHYVPTELNPADIGSRGFIPSQLNQSNIWWFGPDYLLLNKEHWPKKPTHKVDNLPETKIVCHVSLTEQVQLEEMNTFVTKYSSFEKLRRILAYVHRFIFNCRYPNNKFTNYLKISELNSSVNSLCLIVQKEMFKNEYNVLKNNNQLPLKNKLINVNPFLHTDNLIRVGGRLSNSNYDYDTKHPIILHASHHVTKLLFEYYHKLLLHAGPQLLLATIRHKYWPIGGRNLARKTVHNCITCCRFAGKSVQPIMGNLPEQRVHIDYPFINTAVDYAGPILIANRKGRGCQLIKSYVCVFVCLAVRAVHIELVTELSSQAFIAALNRFIARRGKPANIFSDNASNFVGTSNELARLLKSSSLEISKYASENSINFQFSPAYSPHFNGLAEGSVKSIKHHLKRVLALANLTYEEMNTLLVQIESILNSRPLTPLSSDPRDLVPLTPAHFLIGRTLMMLPSPQVNDSTVSVSRYMRTQQLKTHFWSRYYKEYISELQKRQKWHKDGRRLKLGEMVVVKDDRLPPNRWLLGRVTGLHPGSDGVPRVADVYTTSGTLRRAFNRLCPLPILETSVPKGGAC
ncbi:uncharacterized protein [Choristoneura fumiferana]|uniref:uncharacterized protein n=1 Tax=Choristoneura fumiferana TaxID=7141 RepID=UPI003D15C9C7